MIVQASGFRKKAKRIYNCDRRNRRTAKKKAAKSWGRVMKIKDWGKTKKTSRPGQDERRSRGPLRESRTLVTASVLPRQGHGTVCSLSLPCIGEHERRSMPQ